MGKTYFKRYLQKPPCFEFKYGMLVFDKSCICMTPNVHNCFCYLLARFDKKRFAVASTVNGGDAPRDADSQEDVYRVTSSHIAHTCISILVLASGHFARERVWNNSIHTESLLLWRVHIAHEVIIYSAHNNV